DELTQEIEEVNQVSATQKIGGRNRQLRVVLDKDKLAASGLDFLGVAEMIKANNQQMGSGGFDKNDTEFLVTTGNFLKSATDVENLVVGVQQNQPIYLKQVAAIFDGP
ncbi:MAG TPA: multidrug transporter AcrB, partial [Aequorivita sp.]|nr:multidrug transporter AcrB [Aequorivita sp.]